MVDIVSNIMEKIIFDHLFKILKELKFIFEHDYASVKFR